MVTPRSFLLVPLAFVLTASTPCIWDKDTLGDELRGLPGAFDLVSGRWFTHGKPYYRKRVEVLPGHLRENPDDLPAYDDLAVAHERLKDRDQAIAVMEQKAAALRRAEKASAKNHKEQLYRYHANLGTFYAHSGRFDRALLELRKAIAINPEAHFGRERFQIDLIEYIAAARKDKTLWTKHNFLTWSNYQMEKKYWNGRVTRMSFTTRVRRQKDRTKHKWTTWQKAYTAVAGMVRFGGIEGSELYRVVGDLFLTRQDLHLAWWSFRRAIERGHPAKAELEKTIASIEKHWREAKKIVGGVGAVPTPKLFAAVRKDARAWRAAFWHAEQIALQKGHDTGAKAVIEQLVAVADKAVPRRKFATSPGGGRRARGPAKDQNGAQAQREALQEVQRARNSTPPPTGGRKRR